MIGCIDIGFRPTDDAVSKILGIIWEQGYTLRGLRLIPCRNAERSTLKVDIGTCRATPDMQALAEQLLSLEETIAVIHGANGKVEL